MKGEFTGGELDPAEWQLWRIVMEDRRPAWVYEFGREFLRRHPEIERLPLVGEINQISKPWLSLGSDEQSVLRQLAEIETAVECFGREINPDLFGPQVVALYPFGLNSRAAYLADHKKLRDAGMLEGWVRPKHVDGFSLAVNWQWPLSRIIDALRCELEKREDERKLMKRLPSGRGEFGIAGRASWGDNLIRLGQARLLDLARKREEARVREWAKGWWDNARHEAQQKRKARKPEIVPGEASEKDFTRADAAVKTILRRFCHFAA